MSSHEETSGSVPPRKFPKVSVLTPSLNHGRFLRETIESVIAQSYPNVEHIVVDGGSTDGTLDILKEYGSRIRWISEPEKDEIPILEAWRKAFALSTGEYIIHCCVSDGFLNRNWFRMCVDALEADPEISVVWGVSQLLSEDGNLGKVNTPEYLDKPPPQKKDFSALWLALATCLWENYCIRRQVYDACFPQRECKDPMNYNAMLTFNYRFNASGYLPYFLPIVANYGRTHVGDQLGIRQQEKLDFSHRHYTEAVKQYQKDVLSGKTRHLFRDGHSRVIGEIGPRDLPRLKKKIFLFQLKHKLRKKLLRIVNHL